MTSSISEPYCAAQLRRESDCEDRVGLMSERPPPEALKDLDSRLKALRSSVEPPHKKGAADAPQSGMGAAFMIAAHLVAGLAAGVIIGLALDAWLGTKPLFLILFFFLGAAAGGMNVYRTVKGMGMAVGYHAPDGGDQGTSDACQGVDNELDNKNGGDRRG